MRLTLLRLHSQSTNNSCLAAKNANQKGGGKKSTKKRGGSKKMKSKGGQTKQPAAFEAAGYSVAKQTDYNLPPPKLSSDLVCPRYESRVHGWWCLQASTLVEHTQSTGTWTHCVCGCTVCGSTVLVGWLVVSLNPLVQCTATIPHPSKQLIQTATTLPTLACSHGSKPAQAVRIKC